MPAKRTSLNSQRIFRCDCPTLCNSVLTVVSKTSFFHTHKKHRKEDSQAGAWEVASNGEECRVPIHPRPNRKKKTTKNGLPPSSGFGQISADTTEPPQPSNSSAEVDRLASTSSLSQQHAASTPSPSSPLETQSPLPDPGQVFSRPLSPIEHHVPPLSPGPQGTLPEAAAPSTIFTAQASGLDSPSSQSRPFAARVEDVPEDEEDDNNDVTSGQRTLDDAYISPDGSKWNFIEGITGEPVTNERKASIRSYCRDFYAHMHNILNATSIKPPKTWDSGADLYWKTHLEYKLETEFPELRYCEEHWKSAYIAVQTYPAFMDELRKKADKIKSEDTEAGPIDVTTNLSQARQPSSISARPATATTQPIGPSTTALGKRRVGNTSAQSSTSGDASQQKRQRLMSSTRANTLDSLWSPSPNPSGCATTPGHTLPASFAAPVPASSARTGSDDHSLNTVPNSSASHATPGSGCLVPAGGTTGSVTVEDPESLDTSLGPGPHASQDLLPTTLARPPQATAHIADSLPGVSENPDGIDNTQLDEATIAQAMQTAIPLGSAAMESQQALTATTVTLETPHATCPEMAREAAAAQAAAAQEGREAVANTAMTTQTQRNADTAGSVSASVDGREPATINAAETSGAVGGASKSTGRAKSRKFSATNAKTPRGFCGREWAQAHPHGTTKEFNAHFDTLSPEELQRYTDLADAEKRAKKGVTAS